MLEKGKKHIWSIFADTDSLVPKNFSPFFILLVWRLVRTVAVQPVAHSPSTTHCMVAYPGLQSSGFLACLTLRVGG